MASEPTEQVFSYAKQMRVGKAGEEAVKRWLERQGYTYVDVSGDPEWQVRDVDLILNGLLTAEIKTDTHAPVNLYAELTDNDGPGYLYRCRADILLYYFPGAHKLFWLSPAALAWWVHEHAGALQRFEIKSRKRTSGATRTAVGIAVPIADLKAAGLIKEYVIEHGEEVAA